METIAPETAAVSENCPNCKAVPGPSKFCTSCGFPVNGTEEDRKKFRSDKLIKESNLETYEAKVKSARNTLFVIAGFTAVFGTILALLDKNGDGFLLMVINIIIAGIYLALGFWSKQKPFAAIICGLVIYVTLILLNAFADPTTIIQGIIFKVIIIGYMIKGLKSAREAEDLKKEMNIG